MSSTNKKALRNFKDYYITPQKTINDFISKFKELEPAFNFRNAIILDPSAGGCSKHQMAYPTVLQQLGCTRIDTLDIRQDSLAEIKDDYLKWYPTVSYDMVVSNPPFALALDFVAAAIEDAKDGGFVIMLLRLNFFASITRRYYLQQNMPKYCVVHANRPKFNGRSDSCEYAHFVWQKGYNPDYTKTYII
jgi:hypothetical protein